MRVDACLPVAVRAMLRSHHCNSAFSEKSRLSSACGNLVSHILGFQLYGPPIAAVHLSVYISGYTLRGTYFSWAHSFANILLKSILRFFFNSDASSF